MMISTIPESFELLTPVEEFTVSRRTKTLVNTAIGNWFPFHRGTLASLRQKMHEDDVERLGRELRQDIGLFSYTLYRALHQSEYQETLISGVLSPIETITIERNLDTLSQVPDELAEGDSRSMLTPQACMIRFALVSTQCAALMSERSGIDPHFSSSLSLLRVLPYLLVSWSFPNAFGRAFSCLEQGTGDFHQSLESTLRISMKEFTYGLYARFAFEERLMSVLADDSLFYVHRQRGLKMARRERWKIPGKVNREVRFCRLAEALACLSMPTVFPNTAIKWDSMKEEFHALVGKHGLSLINERLEVLFAQYPGNHSSLFDRAINIEQDTVECMSTLKKHRMIRSIEGLELEQGTVSLIEQVYQEMDFFSISPAAIGCLLFEVLPLLGFEAACIYQQGDKESTYVPDYVMGQDILGFNKVMGQGTPGEIARMVQRAVETRGIIKESREYRDRSARTLVMQAFGEGNQTRVFYLQAGKMLVKTSSRLIDTLAIASLRALQDAYCVE